MISRRLNEHRFLLLFVLLLSLVTIVGCSSSKDDKTVLKNSTLNVGLSTANINDTIKLNPRQVELSLTKQDGQTEQEERKKDYQQGDVAFSFDNLTKGAKYNVDVVVKDKDGYEIYHGSDVAVINSDQQTKQIKLHQTEAKGLVVDLKNMPSEAQSGKIRLLPAQDTLTEEIDLAKGQAQFGELTASNYALEVELFDEQGSIYKEQTKPNLSILPGRVTNIKVDLSSDTKLIVDVDWSSAFAPEAPSGLSAEGRESGIQLNWDDNAAQYMVYRGKDKDSPLPLAKMQSNNYSDRKAIAGTTYYYWVRAIGEDGLNSDLAGPIEAEAKPTEYDGVKVHFKDVEGTPSIYAWQVKNGEVVQLTGKWPGVKMDAEDNGWYQKSFPGKKDVNMVFIPSAGESAQTPDLIRAQNEWWYKDRQWYSNLPEEELQKPEVSLRPAGGSYNGNQMLEITVVGQQLTELKAEFNGKTVPLTDTEDRIDKTNIKLGDYLADGEEAKLSIRAANDAGTTTKDLIYTRNDSQEADFIFHFKYEGSDTPNIYTWLDAEKPTGKWPGRAMEDEGNGYYVYKLTETNLNRLNLLFNWNNTNDQTADLSVSAQGEYWYEDTDGDGNKELYQRGKPKLPIQPASGTYRGVKTVSISVNEQGGNVSYAGYEFNNQKIDISDSLAATFKLSDYLKDGESGTLTVRATNEYGTTTEERSYTRDDEQSIEKEGFTWDNANVYFAIIDRFYNGDSSNDNSYGRPQEDAWGNRIGTFHGGDIPGLTAKIEDGYFTRLGVNALWITAPYEQIHGFVAGGGGEFAHYAYHGYYALDYTQMDKNMGTAAEFREFVETAHQHGIRIVMDIVMNHAGYHTIQDMNQYDFSAWQNEPLDKDWSPGDGENWDTYNKKYIDYEGQANRWTNWWGPDWIRAGLPGYDQPGNDDETKVLSGLPDFKTESEMAVGIPEFLNKKWQQEGTSNDEWVVPAAKGLREDLGIAPADYISKWLAAWVAEFGIDAFRVDTAKHVGTKQWGELKNLAQDALEKWRANNPTAPGANWDEDFWMVGEVNPYGLNNRYQSDYFDDNDGDGRQDFDALINFGFPKDGDLAAIGSVWGDYARVINSDDKFNLLSYISSHDTQIHAQGNKINAGTTLLLAPGAVQIFYGDEVDREPGSDSSDKYQKTRSDYNWHHNNHDILKHWQKLGQFRNNHPAVGAGSQTDLGDNTYLREYKTDKVVIKLNVYDTTTVNLGSAFADGISLRNAYTGNTDVVEDGKVQFEGQNGVILIERVN